MLPCPKTPNQSITLHKLLNDCVFLRHKSLSCAMITSGVGLIMLRYARQCFCRGLWNVPFVMNVYMIKAAHADLLAAIPADGGIDADIAICKTLRDNVRGMLVVILRAVGSSG